MAGAAAHARKTSGTTRHAARTRELPAGAATDTRDAALPARTTTGAHVLATGPAVAVAVAALTARGLLEDDVSCRAASRCRASRESFSCRHRRNNNRCSDSATNHQPFDQVQFR